MRCRLHPGVSGGSFQVPSSAGSARGRDWGECANPQMPLRHVHMSTSTLDLEDWSWFQKSEHSLYQWAGEGNDGKGRLQKISLCPGNSNAIWLELFAEYAGPP